MTTNIMVQKISEEYQTALNSVRVTICGHFRELPLHSIKRGGLNEYVLIYCINGTGYLTIGNKTQYIGSGDLIFLDREIAHEYGSRTANPWDIFWMHVTGDLSALYPFVSAYSSGYVANIGHQSNVIQSFHALVEHARSSSSAMDILLVNQYGKLILSELFCLRQINENNFIDQIKNYLRAHQTENPTLDKLASEFCISKYHLIRKFKKHTGYTPIEFLSRQKIELACNLLMESADSITAISIQLHYSTPYYFSEQFKEYTGYAPSQFRKLMQRNGN